ncbi:MAG: tRNA pseudouridine(38-40) synthase TruA [Gemmatimonadota bacterium]|nr:tRNA pseudouridine(38-40) synthase TruA [Gemmatimonadota bacterium]MDH4351487.1 tRNA pseudouridine(38-40) synthase TruA [Gemmatimonadota bacterium]MDH5197467.1 tRNA pseudouridine(38-40) synthase TruA [Gemmatimonadota bacterium]
MSEQSWYAVLHYVGRGFAGWQRQPADRTVQAEVEAVLERLDGARVVTTAAGRTDAGVHALGQVVGFTTLRGWTRDELRRAMNALLPPDVWSAEVGPSPPGFHARKDARARRYRYLVGCDAASRSPFRHPFEWALGRPLDAAALAETAQTIVGTHDFRALSAVGQEKPHYRCAVIHAAWQPRPAGAGYIFDVEADRFLHRMVRFLVGISVAIADGRRPSDDLGRLLTETDNRAASPPAPPEGLYLVRVRYDNLQLEGNTD